MIRRGTIGLAVLVATLFAAAPAFAVGPGVITGTVSPASIAPEVEVCVVEVRPSELCTAAAPGGTYRLTGVPAGAQRVEFIPSHRSGYLKQYFDHAKKLEEATIIGISGQPGSEVEHIDADLELGSTIEGTVRAAVGGRRLADVEVCAVEIGTGAAGGCSITDISGAYALVGLPGGTFKVGFWGHGSSAAYAPQFFDGTESFDGATTISVLPPSTVTGVDAELAIGARIDGSVTAASTGVALAEVPVCMFAVAAIAPTQCVLTEPTGAYSLLGIAAGSYQVGFSLSGSELGGDLVSGGDLGYLPQYYDNAATRSGSRILTLGQGQVETGVDAALLSSPVAGTGAPPVLVAGPSSSAVQIIGEPAKPKAKKKCSGVHSKKATKTRSNCGRKPSRKKKRRRRHRHSGTAAVSNMLKSLQLGT